MQSYINNLPHRPKEFIMRLIPMTLAALHIGVAGAATYLLIATDVLTDASIFLIH